MSDAELPVGRTFTKADIEAGFGWRGERPQAWANCRYLVPRGWVGGAEVGQVQLQPGDIVEIGRFDRADNVAQLTVRVMHLQREISAELLLRHQLLTMDCEPISLKTLSALFADSLSTLQAPRGATHLRLAVRLHGNLAFLLSAHCASAAYAGLAETLGTFIASFGPAAPPPQATIEQRQRADVGGMLSFRYPASWRSREVPPIPGKHATDLLAVTNGVPTGMIRVKACAKSLPTRAELQIEDALREWAEAGIATGPLKVNRQVETSARFASGMLQVFECKTLTGAPQELWLVVVQDDAQYVTLSLLTPDRRQEFLAWAWNRTAFDIVTESLA